MKYIYWSAYSDQDENGDRVQRRLDTTAFLDLLVQILGVWGKRERRIWSITVRPRVLRPRKSVRRPKNAPAPARPVMVDALPPFFTTKRVISARPADWREGKALAAGGGAGCPY